MWNRQFGSFARFVLTAIGTLALSADVALAQASSQAQSKWEVEIHSGVAIVKNPADGTGALPLAGETFTTLGGRPTRANSSWFFGDGALLFRQVSTQLGVPASSQLVSLDPVLAASSLQPRTGVPFGLRVSRAISPRIRIEASVDFRGGGVEVTKEALAAIEATRASYVAGWQALLATNVGLQGTTVTAVTTPVKGSASQIVSLGSVNIDFLRRGKSISYFMVGGGVLTTTGKAPEVTLVGHYTTKIGGVFPLDDTDTVTVGYRVDRNLVVTMVGLGWKHFMSPKWGIRGDLREHLSHNRVRTFVDTAPVSVQAPAGFMAAVTPGTLTSIQLSNTSNARSSLSGPALKEFKTFEGTGMESRFLLTGGVFLRF